MSGKQKQNADGKSEDEKARNPKRDGLRETAESIAIAFVLAFLFKTFQAEAYVIPTGSMAPTLYGRHKEVTCDLCGYKFEIGASSEINQQSGLLEKRIEYSGCSNCGRLNLVHNAPVFNGDRIVVNKLVSEYSRFDVVVFKNPEQGHVNYIKRLVGLPNETIRIRHGDLYAKGKDDDSFRICRKDPYVQRDIQLPVYDDNHPPKKLIDGGWPERWAPSIRDEADELRGGWRPAENSWTADRDSRQYQCAPSRELQWLRYQHFFAAQTLREKNPTDGWPTSELSAIPPQLIADYCGFNAGAGRYGDSRGYRDSNYSGGGYWVGDLTVTADVTVEGPTDGALMVMELVEGTYQFQVHIDLITGSATVHQKVADGEWTPFSKVDTPVSGGGAWEICFANVDDRVCLFVDGVAYEFPEGAYERVDPPAPTESDLVPCGIAFRNTTAQVENLLIERDIYYRNDIRVFDEKSVVDFRVNIHPADEVQQESLLLEKLSSPSEYARFYAEESASQLSRYGKYGDYKLGPDEYLMFGDNSPMSKDSRLFDYRERPLNHIYSHRYAVRRRDLIGKALFIFWPHGIPFLKNGRGFSVRNHKGPAALDPQDYPQIRVPFYPNLTRMKKIR